MNGAGSDLKAGATKLPRKVSILNMKWMPI